MPLAMERRSWRVKQQGINAGTVKKLKAYSLKSRFEEK